MRLHILAVVAALVAGPVSLHAQRLTDLKAGAQVRVETCVHDKFSGPLLSADADSVRIATPGSQPPVVLASANVCGYELGAGGDRKHGALVGLGIGGGVGVVLWALAKSLDKTDYPNAPRQAQTFAIVSTLLGVGIGAAAAPERWVRPRP